MPLSNCGSIKNSVSVFKVIVFCVLTKITLNRYLFDVIKLLKNVVAGTLPVVKYVVNKLCKHSSFLH